MGSGTSRETVETIAYNKAYRASKRVRNDLSNKISDLETTMRNQKKTLNNQKRFMEAQVEKARLEALLARQELEARSRVEDEEETKNKCKSIVNIEFEERFGSTVLDMEKAPEFYKNAEDQEKLSSILCRGKRNTNPLEFEQNKQLVPVLRKETGWADEKCKEVIKWFLDPESRIEQEDPNVIERVRLVSDIAVLNFEDLENLDEITQSIERLFKGVNGATKDLLCNIAVDSIETVKGAASLKSVERSKVDEFPCKVDCPAGFWGGKKTLTFRVRTALCFKYLKTTIQNQDNNSTPQIMGDGGETKQIAQRPEDVRVVVAFRTTVHQMKTVEGSMTGEENQFVLAAGWF